MEEGESVAGVMAKEGAGGATVNPNRNRVVLATYNDSRGNAIDRNISVPSQTVLMKEKGFQA